MRSSNNQHISLDKNRSTKITLVLLYASQCHGWQCDSQWWQVLWWRVCRGGKLLGYPSVMINTSADENNPKIFPTHKSDGITATYQQKTKKNLAITKNAFSVCGRRLRGLFPVTSRRKLYKQISWCYNANALANYESKKDVQMYFNSRIWLGQVKKGLDCSVNIFRMYAYWNLMHIGYYLVLLVDCRLPVESVSTMRCWMVDVFLFGSFQLNSCSDT